MVYAITPNPALDLNGSVPSITENEKNYVIHENRYPGGNSINSARVLTNLRCPVKAGGFLGGTAGEQVKKCLNKEGVRTDFVTITGETRINLTVSIEETHKQTRFSFPGPKIELKEKNKLLKKLRQQKQGSVFMLGGSFPPQFTVQDAKKILDLAHKKMIPTIIDVPSRHLRSLLRSKPLMIKPNLFEFEELVEKKLNNISEIISEAKMFLNFCPVICISSVDNGVLLVTRDGTYFGKGPRIAVKSSVGAGDSLVGAIAAGLLHEHLSYEMFFDKNQKLSSSLIKSDVWKSILSLGVGAALATISLPGTSLGKRDEILNFSKKVHFKKIN